LPRNKRDVESALLSKGFERDSRDHRYFIFHTVDGRRTPLKTKTSHGTSTRTLGDDLISQMSRQCGLTRNDFLRLVDCPLSREEYENKVRDLGRI
jgi:hypothetical protein